jgi:hypothetical protein
VLEALLAQLLKLDLGGRESPLEGGLPLEDLVADHLVLFGDLRDVLQSQIVYLGQAQAHLLLDPAHYVGERLEALL